MKTTKMMIILTLVLTLTAGIALAWGSGKGQDRMWDGKGQNCPAFGNRTGGADLTEDQKKQIADLRQAFIDDTYELRSSQLVKGQQIQMLMETSNPDRAKLDTLFNEMDDLNKQIRSKRLDFQLAAKKIAPDFRFGQRFGKGRGHMNKNKHGQSKGRGPNPNCPMK